MSKADAVAAVLWTGATFYAIFGGADFGAGLWDLLCGSGEKGLRARALVERSLTPVWEANHVWLIFILVVLWTGFPEAFSAIFSTLYVPLSLALLGIVIRGAGFAFRGAITGALRRRAAGIAFALSSVLTPFFMGTVVGAVASGRVPPEGNGDPFSSWLALAPVMIGLLFVATGAYLAAVFLLVDARRGEDPDLQAHFAVRVLASGAAAGIAAVGGLLALRADARFVFDGLLGDGLALVIASAVCGIVLLVVAARGVHRALRPLAVAAVVTVIWGWGVAQFPYLLPTSLTISESAAPDATLTALLVVFGAALLFVVPALALLYTLTQRDELSEQA